MSGSTTVAVAGGGGGGGGISGYRPPFTPVQWQELEHQALIYKYLVAGVPVPYDLVVPIRRSLEALSARFFTNPTSLSYCSYYGKKFDPEPGRCRRTDGKKWRCSKDAYPDSKYCERHMHRGRNRSRKPVESQSQSLSQSQSQSASQSLSTTAVSNVSTVSNGGNRSYQNLGNGSFQNSSLYPTSSSCSFDFGSNVSKLQVHGSAYGINNNSFRYDQSLTVDVDDQNYTSNTWRLLPNQIPTSSLMESRTESYLQTKSMVNFDSVVDPISMPKPSQQQQQQQHCLFGSKIGSPIEVKNEQQSMRPFFDEWPEAREPWSTTQLSMSTTNDYTARSDCTSNDG
ncbi:hypothetical protein Lser_V15G29980 [Lactuca serriola]